MVFKNYYDILEVEQNASLEAIKKAFRIKIAIYHPENNKSEEAKNKFDDIVEAFDILSKTEKRGAYDEMLNEQSQNKPLVLEQKQEEQLKDWSKEAKQKSKKYGDTTLTDLLALDLLLDTNIIEGLLDDLGDTIGDVLDLF